MISDKQHTKLSKFLSLVLRHKPETIGIILDDNGWASVDDLIAKMNQYGKPIDFKTLELLVAHNNKQRFGFNADKTMIRANQGHSLTVDLGYSVKTANKIPDVLYHGTASRFVANIYEAGAINKMQRHHVHLSQDIDTARAVGQRHGKLVIFAIDTQAMLKEGLQFYQSDNGVWLTDKVPVRFIRKLDDRQVKEGLQ